MANADAVIWSAVAARFEERGWTEQLLNVGPNNRQWALQRPNGLVATTSIFVAALADEGQVAMSPGVSHGQVAALRAALTLSARHGELLREGPMLLRPTPLSQPELQLMVDEVTVTAAAIADAFDDADQLLETLGAKAREGNERALESAFLLAGALRDADAASRHLGAIEAAAGPGGEGAAKQLGFLKRSMAANHARFVRQARRWLEAGMPDVPPISERPRPRPAARPGFGQVLLTSLKKSDARHDAELRLFRALRRDRSLTTADLRRILDADLAAHGLTQDPTGVAIIVDRVQREQTLLGLVRTQVDSAQHLLELTRRIRTAIEEKHLPTTPAEAAPPEHAVFTYRSDRNAHAEVVLEPEAIPRLRALAAGTQIRVRRIAFLTVWLDGDRVMVGDLRAGTLSPGSARAFAPTLAAATALAEFPRAHAFFVDLPEPVLSFQLPEGTPGETPYG